MKFFSVLLAVAAASSVAIAAPVAEPSLKASCWGVGCGGASPIKREAEPVAAPEPSLKESCWGVGCGGASPIKREAEPVAAPEPTVKAACWGVGCGGASPI
ncbi:hypothetical protein Q5752_001296 [Cryptotrichosporon argae]